MTFLAFSGLDFYLISASYFGLSLCSQYGAPTRSHPVSDASDQVARGTKDAGSEKDGSKEHRLLILFFVCQVDAVPKRLLMAKSKMNLSG